MDQSGESQLSDAERAILAGLEANAEADDPHLAAALKGGNGRTRTLLPPTLALPRVDIHPRVPDQVAGWGWGLMVGLAGFVVMVLSVSTSLAASVVGALLAFLGAGRVAVCSDQITANRRVAPAPGQDESA